jgi:hypothetical protein
MLRAVRLLLIALALPVAACSSSSPGTPTPPMTCESAGYLTPAAGGTCPAGTCAQSGVGESASLSCCGSACMTCESEGYVSFTDAGTCPAGTCPSGDVTAMLSCCGTTVCGGNVDAGIDAADAGDAGDGATEARAPDAADGGQMDGGG